MGLRKVSRQKAPTRREIRKHEFPFVRAQRSNSRLPERLLCGHKDFVSPDARSTLRGHIVTSHLQGFFNDASWCVVAPFRNDDKIGVHWIQPIQELIRPWSPTVSNVQQNDAHVMGGLARMRG